MNRQQQIKVFTSGQRETGHHSSLQGNNNIQRIKVDLGGKIDLGVDSVQDLWAFLCTDMENMEEDALASLLVIV